MIESRITNRESRPSVHVVAAILRDAQGRMLLAQRGPRGDYPGAWEFPGGKVEPGEPPEVALRRELREELGIELGDSEPLIAVPQDYPHKRIVLDARVVRTYAGEPHGREGQALRWVDPAALRGLAMPPADRPLVAALNEPSLYLVTPPPGDDDDAFLAAFAVALEGVQRAQLRLPPALDEARAARLARAAASLAAARGVQLLLNSGHSGAPALAAELGLGLHLRAADLAAPPDGARAVAASCHDEAELRRADHIGVDFAVLGPLRATTTHPGAAPLGWARFAALRAAVPLPVYALGGLALADVAEARTHGAQGIAAIRGLWPAEPSRN